MAAERPKKIILFNFVFFFFFKGGGGFFFFFNSHNFSTVDPMSNIFQYNFPLKLTLTPPHRPLIITHSYCTHVLTEEINECAAMLLSELLRFQDRQFLKDPIKAKMKKRCVNLL